MICFSHSENSIGKEQFYKYKINAQIANKDYIPILESISNIKYDPDHESSDEEN